MSLNISLIKESFEKAKPIADQVANKFYEFLWGDYPQSKQLFNGVNMEKQKKALINSLVFIVDNIDNGDKVIPYLEKMGVRHINYGTKDEHYSWVGNSLIKTFAHFFGDSWTVELEENWTTAYGLIANTMIQAAHKAAGIEVNQIKERARGVCNQLLKNLLDDGLDEEFKQHARQKVRQILVQALEEESAELLKKAG